MLKACSIHKCVLGVRTRVEDEVVLQDSLVMGADYFESMEERTLLRERGGIPIGVGRGTTVKRAILDKNARIGENVTIVNKDHVEEADVAERVRLAVGGFALGRPVVRERPDLDPGVADHADRRDHLGARSEPAAHDAHEPTRVDLAAESAGLILELSTELVERDLAALEALPRARLRAVRDDAADEPLGEPDLVLVPVERVERRREHDPAEVEEDGAQGHGIATGRVRP